MLYIKFNIHDALKYQDFRKLYDHMAETRKPGFDFNEEITPEFDWDSMPQEEINDAVEILSGSLDQEPAFNRYQKFIPGYANEFLEKYLQFDNDALGSLGKLNTLAIFNYLECGFEVNMEGLEKEKEKSGLVEFSTGNFPFGGMERFLITLKAFDLTPTEYFDGFSVNKLEWLSNFEYKTIKLPEKTHEYLKRNKT